MHMDELNAVTDQINEGAEVPSVEPELIEHVWEAIRSIPEELRATSRGMHLTAKTDPNLLPQSPEQRVGMMMRYGLMNALIERGLLDEYMKDESGRKKVFAAAAKFPCDKNDLAEAVAQQLNQKTNEELRQAGYDPDHPKVAERLVTWMREHC